MHLGTTEIILIIILALVLFGGSKLTGIGKALGTSIKDFKKAVKDDDKNTDSADEDDGINAENKNSKTVKGKGPKSAAVKDSKSEGAGKKTTKNIRLK